MQVGSPSPGPVVFRNNAAVFLWGFMGAWMLMLALFTCLYVRDGGLLSYGPSAEDTFERAAVYLDKIFKGAKPADLPAEYPTRYYLTVNLKAAEAMGLTIPPVLLIRADSVLK